MCGQVVKDRVLVNKISTLSDLEVVYRGRDGEIGKHDHYVLEKMAGYLTVIKVKNFL